MARSLTLLVLFLSTPLAGAADWPQWLGPNRDGASAEKVAPWTGAPKVLWRHPVGEGNSSPVVAAGKVFLHGKTAGKDEEEVLAFDARTGKPLWQTPYPRGAGNFLYGNGPRATPAVAGGQLFAFGITGILSCLETEKGTIVWQKNTLKEFQAGNLFFGASCSPLVEEDKVLVNVGGRDASIVAFVTANGNVVWKSLSAKASYSSPIVFGDGPQRQVVFLTEEGLASLNPKDGTVYWQFAMKDKLSESSTTPVRVGDSLLASSVTLGSFGLHLAAKDGKPAAEEIWKNAALTCYFSTPVPVGDRHVYLVTGSLLPPQRALLRCIDVKTGKETWPKPKVVGVYHSSLLRTGDNKLLLLEEAGNLVLLDPDPSAYRELARSKVCGQTWAHPALANGLLYLRDNKELLCVQLAVN